MVWEPFPQVRGVRGRAKAMGYSIAPPPLSEEADSDRDGETPDMPSARDAGATEQLPPDKALCEQENRRWWDCEAGLSARSAPPCPTETEAAPAMGAWHLTEDGAGHKVAGIDEEPIDEVARLARYIKI